MQNKTYAITALLDGELHTLAEDVPEEEVEGTLQHLTRKHELKNVGRYEVRPSEARTAYPKGAGRESSRGRGTARGKRESGGASTASDDCSRAERSVASRTARATPDAFPADDRKGGSRTILNTSSITRT